ncbi:hypothetical protein PCE1_004520 [Barthelona sp. PCE]
MKIALADKLSLFRVFILPFICWSYLNLPAKLGLPICAVLALAAEISDWLDGYVARKRKEVSDTGKLLDPFCDTLYRMSCMLILLLPPGFLCEEQLFKKTLNHTGSKVFEPLVFFLGKNKDKVAMASGILPFSPIILMVLREIIITILRAMTATKGKVMAARFAGKLKAFMQGVTICCCFTLPIMFAYNWVPIRYAQRLLNFQTTLAWICACLSIYSMSTYFYDNRGIIRQLLDKRKRKPKKE